MSIPPSSKSSMFTNVPEALLLTLKETDDGAKSFTGSACPSPAMSTIAAPAATTEPVVHEFTVGMFIWLPVPPAMLYELTINC